MRILYVTPYLPYEGVPYAGGYFLYEYLVRLSAYVDVQVIAPRTEENELAAAKLRHEFKVELLGDKPVKKSKAARLLPILWNHLVHPMNIPEMDNLSKELGKPGYLDDFDAVEMHFSQALPLAKVVKKARPELPTVIFAHDVFSQSVHRRVRGAPFSPGKLLNAIKSLRVSSVEASYMNRCDGAFVFSDKDKNILGGMGVRTRVEVLVPSVELPRRTAPLEGGPVCLFVGAMDRPENHEAASWLLSNVWPDVLERVPEASLKIVGAILRPI
ncbi:hypothetical protein [Cohnella faecalis]|uniref:Glycosyltransferase subfamily 4-like N-terminal domain-containing protein n=1 Tax=Cohnella faecalis TaxID=2315694 RepID=A0A398CV96_9BACL|nr:hypothetical protein [Cohnella faecalis]RIE03817.1 hypothetical protein D3H35_09700 [Cohnella faecalis]